MRLYGINKILTNLKPLIFFGWSIVITIGDSKYLQYKAVIKSLRPHIGHIWESQPYFSIPIFKIKGAICAHAL